MSNPDVSAFVAYATAFEKSYAEDDWSHVDRLTHDDVVWSAAGAPPPFGGVWTGRSDTLSQIRTSVGAFDRRFDERVPRVLSGPTPIPGGVHMSWAVVYRRAGLPDFELQGEEWDLFQDGKLVLHREVIHNAKETVDFLTRHAKGLRPARSS
jgi:hypothetical protein